MPQLLASYAKAKAITDAARGEVLPLDLGFAIDEATQTVRLTLTVAGDEATAPFAEHAFSANEFSRFVAQLNVIRDRLATGNL